MLAQGGAGALLLAGREGAPSLTQGLAVVEVFTDDAKYLMPA